MFFLSCYHPNFCLLDGSYQEDGKPKNKVIFDNKFNRYESWDEFKSYVENNITTYNPLIKPLLLPCGKCIGCKLDKSREWANRCVLELNPDEENWFITLTYDDEHLPYSHNYNDLTKSFCSVPTLRKKDLSDFIKRLRRHFEYYYELTNIRFFACGEYGTNNHRPHYHGIFYNLPLSDDLEYKFSKNGNSYFTSQLISKLWPNGLHIISHVTWDTCAYTARYCLKKASDSIITPQWSDCDFEKEFINMSRRPGIGRDYYDKFKENIYEFDRISDGFKTPIRPPKYYDRLYDIDNPNVMSILKDIRKTKAEQSRFRPQTDLSEKEYLSLCEKSKQERINRLTRPL